MGLALASNLVLSWGDQRGEGGGREGLWAGPLLLTAMLSSADESNEASRAKDTG